MSNTACENSYFNDYSFFEGQKNVTQGRRDVYDFLRGKENVSRMIHQTERGLPALIGVVEELEKQNEKQPDFPLLDYRNRQAVGRMVKNILGMFGYSPCSRGLDRSAALREFARSKLFSTSAIYAKTDEPPKFKIGYSIIDGSKETESAKKELDSSRASS